MAMERLSQLSMELRQQLPCLVYILIKGQRLFRPGKVGYSPITTPPQDSLTHINNVSGADNL